MSKNLSICIANHLRSQVYIGNGNVAPLLPNCIRSLVRSIRMQDDAELIISNYDDSDWPLDDWLDNTIQGVLPYRVVKGVGPFHRGSARNLAADHSNGRYLLFMDADMLVSRNIVENGLQSMRQNKLYYPICFYFLNVEHSLGVWCDGAKGINMMPREVYEQAGKWPSPPYYIKHHNEDIEFYKKVQALGYAEVNQREPNYFHQYHPGLTANRASTLRRKQIRDSREAWAQYCADNQIPQR